MSASQHDKRHAGQTGSQHQPASPSSPTMSAIVNGPVDPHAYYSSSFSSTLYANNSPVFAASRPQSHRVPDNVQSFRSFSQSPEGTRMRQPTTSTSHLAVNQSQKLNSARSQPVLSARQPAVVVPALANSFSHGDAVPGAEDVTIRVPNEKYRRPFPPPKNSSPRSPIDHSRSDQHRMYKRKPVSQSPTTLRSPDTSFDTVHNSFESDGARSHTGHARDDIPVRVHPPDTRQPLFGEITPDGAWNGEVVVADYALHPNYFSVNRRSSDGNIALSSSQRTRSNSEMLHPGYPPSDQNKASHRRSRSDLTTTRSHESPALSQLVMQTFPVIHQAQPSHQEESTSRTHQPPPPVSRIPKPGRKHSSESQPASGIPSPRSTSALSARRHIAKDSEQKAPSSRENERPQGKRYIPPKIPQITQLLSAKVTSPPPKISPPLRSSRPRQPVSSATTAASRARAANTQQTSQAAPSQRAKPSEQWLGKPYDPKQEKSKRKIVEIGKIDFAERRARIQKALSRNLEESASVEQLQQQLAAEAEAKKSSIPQRDASTDGVNIVDQHQAAILETETQSLGLPSPAAHTSPRKPLTVQTTDLPAPKHGESSVNTADTEVTEFEIGDTPDSAYGQDQQHSSLQHQRDDLQLLSATTYVPPARRKAEAAPTANSASLGGATSQIAQIASPESSPSDIEDKWGLKRGVDNLGSIRIMLDENPSLLRLQSRSRNNDREEVGDAGAVTNNPQPQLEESPIVPQLFQSPHKKPASEVVLQDPPLLAPAVFNQVPELHTDSSRSLAVSEAIDRFRSTGDIAPEFVRNFDKHTVDLHRISANGGSDAALVQSLLDSITAQHSIKPRADSATLPVTPRTPPDALNFVGTAVVYNQNNSVEATPDRRSDDAVLGSDDDDEFAVQIRNADAEWERAQRGEGPMFVDDDAYSAPAPPPKDEGYTPHSSIGPDTLSLDARWPTESYRDSLSEERGARNPASKNVDSVISEEAVISAPITTPSLPQHAPPPPPITTASASRQDGQSSTAGSFADEQPVAQSPHIQQLAQGSATGSERPSVDSQRQPQSHPASLSASSFADSARAPSNDLTSDQPGRQGSAISPSPEQKRLFKRKNTIRELLDTENTYHQDLKIIEDIYKATVADFVTPEDRKILFGNCDEIERFSLQFYDQLRKAAAPIYMPSKNARWGHRRGSMSTNQSDGQTSVMSADTMDESRDKATYIGKVFLENLVHMEQLYGAYLRNHDAANQRLSALQTTPTVKFWLDECHNNASDITSAWDLDSLLVKPTQRVSKYPLILQQLLEATPAEHPDYESLKSAARDTVAMLTRINEAKKRADIVEQMISGKRKEIDVRSGLAKAFGRRTERLKERVGINEAFQDPEFDALAQAFGGHYLKLQVTMRDFQDYTNQVERAIQSTNNYSAALELFTDVHQSSMPEIESKWRRYGQIIRELTAVSLASHKEAVQRRVVTPLIALIKIHESPQRAINKRKKHIVDYAKCKSIEKRGERPDKKTIEASEMYEALNDQLKIELPKLYEMTGKLIKACLACFVQSQLEWQQAFERKLAPLLDVKDVPKSIQDIVPSFNADFDFVRTRLTELGICNGSILADTSNFLSSSGPTTLDGDSRRPSNSENAKLATAADLPPQTGITNKRHSRNYTPEVAPVMETPVLPAEARVRSNSSMSHQTGMTPVTPIAMLTSANRPWSNSVTTPPSSAYPSRPSTSQAHRGQYSSITSSVRSSMDQARDPRHDSTASFVTARDTDNHRFSGIFSSAMPPSDNADSSAGARATSPTPVMTTATDDTRVLFTCASLYEFAIDQERKEAGYSYHTYETGAIFDVVAQKGELWLAVNQDDSSRTLGWVWEQHFAILSTV